MREFILQGGSDRLIVLGSGQPVAPLWGVGWGNKQKGICRLQELNRNPMGGLGCLEECVDAGRGSWWRTGGQAQVAKLLFRELLAFLYWNIFGKGVWSGHNGFAQIHDATLWSVYARFFEYVIE